MIRIAYNPYPNRDTNQVIIYGDKFGQKIEMTEGEFYTLTLDYEKQKSDYFERELPFPVQQLNAAKRTNELLREIKEKLDKLEV